MQFDVRQTKQTPPAPDDQSRSPGQERGEPGWPGKQGAKDPNFRSRRRFDDVF